MPQPTATSAERRGGNGPDQRYPDAIIIGLSVNMSAEDQETMERACAVRLIPKEESIDMLYDAIPEAVQSR